MRSLIQHSVNRKPLFTANWQRKYQMSKCKSKIFNGQDEAFKQTHLCNQHDQHTVHVKKQSIGQGMCKTCRTYPIEKHGQCDMCNESGLGSHGRDIQKQITRAIVLARANKISFWGPTPEAVETLKELRVSEQDAQQYFENINENEDIPEWLLEGKKRCRSFWGPTTQAMKMCSQLGITQEQVQRHFDRECK